MNGLESEPQVRSHRSRRLPHEISLNLLPTALSRLRQILNFSRAAVFLHRLDAVLGRRLGSIHFTLSDYLLIGGLQDEIRLIGGGGLQLEILRVRAVDANRVDPSQRRRFLLINLARQNHFVIGGLEVKTRTSRFQFS